MIRAAIARLLPGIFEYVRRAQSLLTAAASQIRQRRLKAVERTRFTPKPEKPAARGR